MAPEAGLDVAVLGGGPAGLAAAWRLEELGRAYRVLEAAPACGGNARTLRSGEFLYDAGPHRFHDRDPGTTRRIRDLLRDDLREVTAPSRIFWEGRFVDFPLRPVQALLAGGAGRAARAVLDLARARLRRPAAPAADFRTFAVERFGRTIAESFLIPFSEKLWGVPAAELSPDVAGRRLPGFSLAGLARELLLGGRADHLEGRFLYPRQGFGRIVEAMEARLAPGAVRCGTRVRRIHADGDRIASVVCEREGLEETVAAPAFVSTLPITFFVGALAPAAPAAVRAAARRLRFRQVVLGVLFLDQASLSDAACTYFADSAFEFSRAHEPRVRSPLMSPPGKTSLVVEFPCFEEDAVWRRDRGALLSGLVRDLDAVGLISASRVTGGEVVRLRDAYPVYARDSREASREVLSYLRRFGNLETVGRGGMFLYGHVHDFVAAGALAAERLTAGSHAVRLSPLA